ncbi:hypothetical protein, partial [Mesorhizobium sp.]|uniref:hypothetical protein n=1 Tax=Mesorhizobium sp. TaxID=1871066 RepID=UPI00257E3E4A
VLIDVNKDSQCQTPRGLQGGLARMHTLVKNVPAGHSVSPAVAFDECEGGVVGFFGVTGAEIMILQPNRIGLTPEQTIIFVLR